MGLEEMTKIDNLKSWTSDVDVDWDTVKQLPTLAELPILGGHARASCQILCVAYARTSRNACRSASTLMTGRRIPCTTACAV